MDIGIHSFAAIFPDSVTGALPSATDRMAGLLEEIEVADRVGLDFFGIGEHHRAEFLDSAPAVILAAAAARSSRIKLTSAVTVLSAADPVRVFQEFATLDLISRGRTEIIVGRGSSVEAFPLFGLPMRDYDDLFNEKLDPLVRLGEIANPTWEGPATVVSKFRHASEVLGGISRVAFQMTSAAFETAAMIRSIELLGTKVAPAMRAVNSNSRDAKDLATQRMQSIDK